MAMGTYIGVLGPVYEDQDGTPVNITASNISTHFTVTNGGYRFKGSGSTFTTTNGGVASSTASTALKALYDMRVSFNYSYSSEANWDKFTLKVNGEFIENAVSGATTSKTYSGTLRTGQTIYFEYTKDGSEDGNADQCTFSNMVVTPFAPVQVGEAGLARTVKREYKEENGVIRKFHKAYKEVDGVARQVFLSETKWTKHSCDLTYRYSDPTDFSYESDFILSVAQFGTLRTYKSYTFSESAGFQCSGELVSRAVNGIMNSDYAKFAGTYYSSGDSSRIFRMGSNIRAGWANDEMDYVKLYGGRYVATSTKTAVGGVKGSKSYGTVSAEDGQLPEEGTLIQGSPNADYCVVLVGSNYYYYEREI